MLVLLSPAKDMNLDPPPDGLGHSMPELMKETRQLVDAVRRLSKADLKRLMHVNDKLAALNHERFRAFSTPFTPDNAKQAALAFAGDVYRGLDATTLTADDLAWAQDHVRILSGLFGLLRPLDLIQPYRLEMGLPLKTERGATLYEFWGTKLTDKVNDALKRMGGATIVNLASHEYFGAVDAARLKGRLVTPQFKEVRDGKARSLQFFLKKARGLMARFIVQNRIEDAAALKDFNAEGYRIDARLSDGDTWVFARPSGKGRNAAPAAASRRRG